MKKVSITFLTYDDEFNWITKKFISKEHTFFVRDNEAINTLLMRIVIRSGFLFHYWKHGYEVLEYFKISYKGEAREVRNKSIRVSSLLNLFEEKERNHISLYWDFRPGGGAGVLQSEGIYFFIHTDEAIHKYDPHVHARYGGKTMKISILSPHCIGSLGNKKKERAAMRIVHENEKLFMEKWHEYTCGLSVDAVYYDNNTNRLEKEQVG